MVTDASLLGPATGLVIFLAILGLAFLYIEVTRTPTDPQSAPRPDPKDPPHAA